MRNARSAIVFWLILTMGLSLSILPEDVAETAFDESETQPYESTALFSMVVRLVATRTAEGGLNFVSVLRCAPATGCCQCPLPYERVSTQSDSDSLTILDCSVRC
jgi:hypothetical protein